MATYATWNPEDKNAAITLSEGNLLATSSANNWKSVRANQGKDSGKWYFEYTVLVVGPWLLGVSTADATVNSYVGANNYSYGYNGTARKYHGGSWQSFGNTYGVGDVIGVAVDLDDGKLYWSKNGVWQGSADPANGTNPAFTGLTGTFYPMASPYANGGQIRANFGASDLSYSAPSGYNSGWYESSGSTDALTASDILAGIPVVGQPALGFNQHDLTALSILTGSPLFGQPVLSDGYDDLTAQNIITGVPLVGSPVLAVLTDELTALDILAGTPEVGTPTLTNPSLLIAQSIIAGTPVIGKPSLWRNLRSFCVPAENRTILIRDDNY